MSIVRNIYSCHPDSVKGVILYSHFFTGGYQNPSRGGGGENIVRYFHFGSVGNVFYYVRAVHPNLGRNVFIKGQNNIDEISRAFTLDSSFTVWTIHCGHGSHRIWNSNHIPLSRKLNLIPDEVIGKTGCFMMFETYPDFICGYFFNYFIKCAMNINGIVMRVRKIGISYPYFTFRS